MTPPICAYADHDGTASGPRCNGPAVFTAHDGRGCRDVCFAHVKWLMAHSWAFGHGSTCPGNPTPPAKRSP